MFRNYGSRTNLEGLKKEFRTARPPRRARFRHERIETLEERCLLAIAALEAELPSVAEAVVVDSGQPAANADAPAAIQYEVVRNPELDGRASDELVLAGYDVSLLADDGTSQFQFVSPADFVATQDVEFDAASLFEEEEGGTQNAIGTPDIIIDPGPTLAANQPALDAFNRAAEQWEALFDDPIIVTLDADMANLGSPNVIGSASSVILSGGFDLIRNQLVADADADDGLLTSLPTAAQFSATLPAGFGVSGSLGGTKASLKAAGFSGLDATFGATDATITFNTQFTFDFDNSDGVTPGTIDFESVAAHEIGHALGFVTIVDTVDFFLDQGSTATVTPRSLDLFRFLNDVAGADPASTTDFTNFPREISPAVNSITDDLTSEWRMSTGVETGDGRQASHWKDNGITGQLIGIMDPTLASGTIVPITNADIRAFDLIGWDHVFSTVNEPPELAFIPNQAVSEGSLVSFTASATDPNPGDLLTYSLGPGAPAGATIDPNSGLFQWTPDDNVGSPFPVTIVVSDDGTPILTDEEDVNIFVNNAAPTAAISGPTSAVPGQPRTYTLTATDPSSVDQASNFTFDIDWDGDSVVDETVVGLSGLEVEHEFLDLGSFDVAVTARDKDGGQSAPVETTVDVTRFALQPNEDTPSLTNLAFGGTQGFDAVFFLPIGGDTISMFSAVVGNQLINEVDILGGVDGIVQVYGLGGADILAADFLPQTVEMFGGNGGDILAGGAGADLIDGGAGNDMFFGATVTSDVGDTLIGGDGRDFFYGNLGDDFIDGGTGEDLLIAGTVDFGVVGTALDGLFAIRNEWLSSRDYLTRIDNISGTGTGPKLNGNFFLVPDQTVFSDAASDQLLGGSDLDWFVYGFLLDSAFDPEVGEVETDTDP